MASEVVACLLSRPVKVRISWFTHRHCSPACKAAGTQTLRTTAPLEIAFDTASL